MKNRNTEDFKCLWLPEPWQVMQQSNPNYINSLSVGILAPIWNLPTMIIRLILMPVLGALRFIFLYVAYSFYQGVRGNLIGVEISATHPRITRLLKKRVPKE